MQEYFNSDRIPDAELDMYHCGMEECAPGHFYGPAVRDHFLIHYIRSGKGMFRVGNRIYRLQKGQCFLICPDVVTFYQADRDEPWHYLWVGFHGKRAADYLKSANLTQANPIFSHDPDDFLKECLVRMVETNKIVRGRETRLKGLLFLFLSKLIETANGEDRVGGSLSKKELYITKAIEYIRMNYSRKISIAQIAGYIGLDRSYFCSLFKEHLKISPQEFLINFRINKACDLMRNNLLLIGDISRSVGYEDQLQFSKVFKKLRGLPPREFRKNLRKGDLT